MSINAQARIISIEDVLIALLNHDTDEAYRFASDLTGLSEDHLNEMLHAENWYTAVNYMYRDACNYKKCNRAFVRGIITKAQQKEIISCCDNDTYFIPESIGLPAERFPEYTEDDHPYFEIGDCEPVYGRPSMEILPVTANELVAKFREMKGRWQEAAVDFCP